MAWTIACFCGTTYSTPLGRCPSCGVTLADGAPSRRHPRPVRVAR